MPRIAEFYGIAIYLYYRDHAPPHFHAIYSEHEAEVAIETGDVARGSLPPLAARFVREWALLYRDDLMKDWELARTGASLRAIPPLE